MDLESRMLILKDEKPFAKGGHRACYRHPSDPKKCVKIMTSDWRTTGRRAKASWLDRVCRPKWYFHDNLFEYRFLKGEEKRVGEAAWEFLPRAYEILETDVGESESLVVDLITDTDGEVSVTLVEYLWENGMTDECREALRAMWRGVEENRIFVQGRPDNLVVQKRSDGTCRCYAIDGFGFAQLIPLLRWSSGVAAKRFRKRKEKLRRSIDRILQQREDNSAAPDKGFLL